MIDPNHYSAVGWAVVVLVCIITGLNQGFALWRNLNKGSGPERRQVQMLDEMVKEKDCVGRHASLDKRLTELERQRAQDAKDGSAIRSQLYNHIDSVRRELSEKIDDMPNQIIAILKNTGAIQ